MTKSRVIILVAFVLFILGAIQSTAQEVGRDSLDRIIVDYSDLAEYIRTLRGEIQILTGNVELHQDSNYMYCQRAELTGSNRLTALDEVLIQQTDSVFLFCDSLYYYGNLKEAELFGNVSLNNKTYQLFTDELYYDLEERVARYEKSALLTDGETKMISKRGNYFVNERLAVFIDSVIIIDSNFILKTDSLKFNTASRRCYFVGPTVIKQDEATIYCESGYYDLNSKEALFTDEAEYLNKTQYSTADSMFYFASSNKIHLIGNAYFRDSLRISTADEITFFQDQETAILKGDAYFEEPNRTMSADSIYYNARKEKFYSKGRSEIWDGDQYLEAEEIDFGSNEAWGRARGSVVWKDTVQQSLLLSEEMLYKQSSGEFLAFTVDTIRPYMINIVEGDSLWLSADTLYSFRDMAENNQEKEAIDTIGLGENRKSLDSLSLEQDSSNIFQDSMSIVSSDTLLHIEQDTIFEEPDQAQLDSFRYLRAYHDVRVYKSDFQALCDSLVYKESDSTFYFYVDPIMWSDTSQFIADTMRLLLKEGTIDRVLLDQNALILNSEDELFFNQMKGRHIIAEFDSSEVRRMYVNGNAESLYYGLDEEDAYIGVNYTTCSNMLVYFGDNQVEGIKFYNAPESVMTPMEQADHEGLKLEGFIWDLIRRPKNKWDVIRKERLWQDSTQKESIDNLVNEN
jgi:lipopolysaccharide export system protein LptA